MSTLKNRDGIIAWEYNILQLISVKGLWIWGELILAGYMLQLIKADSFY